MFGNKLKKILDKSKKGEEGNNKKRIENLVVFIVLLIITVIAINIIWNDKKTSTKQENSFNSKKLATMNSNKEYNIENNTNEENETTNLEQKLELILSKIQGVGNVKVFINYSETNEVVAMYNENSKINNTEEVDKTGGTRKIEQKDTQKDIIYKEQNGEKIPVTQKVIQPKLEGAIITAQGAGDATAKSNIIQAVEAATGLATHKIQVFEMSH